MQTQDQAAPNAQHTSTHPTSNDSNNQQSSPASTDQNPIVQDENVPPTGTIQTPAATGSEEERDRNGSEGNEGGEGNEANPDEPGGEPSTPADTEPTTPADTDPA